MKRRMRRRCRWRHVEEGKRTPEEEPFATRRRRRRRMLKKAVVDTPFAVPA